MKMNGKNNSKIILSILNNFLSQIFFLIINYNGYWNINTSIMKKII